MPREAYVSILNGRTYRGLLVFFIVAATCYGLTLELTSRWSSGMTVARMSLDYGLKALISLPVMYLAFAVLRERSLSVRVAVVVALAIPYAFAWRAAYYATCDVFDIGHMGGAGSWWDIYIPLLVYGGQFAGLFALEYHANAVAARAREGELAQAAVQSELSALRAQINPHFLYNTYNAISASLPPEQEEARELLARLAGMFRYQVSVARESLVPLTDELRFVEDYLSLEQARMGDRLSYRVEVDQALTGIQFPPLILQPLLENAIKHGLSPKLEGGEVVLRIATEPHRPHLVCVSVRDTGVGLPLTGKPAAPGSGPSRSTHGTGVGCETTRRRLALQFGSELHLQTGEGGVGAVARFGLPLERLRPGAQPGEGVPRTSMPVSATLGSRRTASVMNPTLAPRG